MLRNRSISSLRAFLLIIIFIGIAIWCVISMIVEPSNRIGPFGLGIPSTMREYILEQQQLAVYFPHGWNILLTPQGNHGDTEVIAIIVVPWHSLPNVKIMNKPFNISDVSLVADWGETRLQSDFSYQSASLTSYNSVYFSGLLREYTITRKLLFFVEEIHCLDLYILTLAMDISSRSVPIKKIGRKWLALLIT